VKRRSNSWSLWEGPKCIREARPPRSSSEVPNSEEMDCFIIAKFYKAVTVKWPQTTCYFIS
jgi:hypothetical protein